jgi:hypothetical protein
LEAVGCSVRVTSALSGTAPDQLIFAHESSSSTRDTQVRSNSTIITGRSNSCKEWARCEGFLTFSTRFGGSCSAKGRLTQPPNRGSDHATPRARCVSNMPITATPRGMASAGRSLLRRSPGNGVLVPWHQIPGNP